jgi:Peptidase C13 family
MASRSGFVGWIAACVAAIGALVLLGRGMAEAAADGAGWQVVLAAGDDAERVFDDATGTLAGRLAAAGVPAANIHRLSASPAVLRRGVEPATAENLLRRIADLPVRPGDRCFVFLTSHGEPGAGLWLARSERALHPEELAQALSRSCAAVPTVVIVSGCYTGSFASGAMVEPNRIILTAARRDRPSFGCQAGRTYTFFDQCLLGALPKAANWQAVFYGTSRCVSREEHALGEQPSEPQAYFGPAVETLSAGF